MIKVYLGDSREIKIPSFRSIKDRSGAMRKDGVLFFSSLPGKQLNRQSPRYSIVSINVKLLKIRINSRFGRRQRSPWISLAQFSSFFPFFYTRQGDICIHMQAALYACVASSLGSSALGKAARASSCFSFPGGGGGSKGECKWEEGGNVRFRMACLRRRLRQGKTIYQEEEISYLLSSSTSVRLMRASELTRNKCIQRKSLAK